MSKIADICSEEQYADGTILFREGENADHLYILEEGIALKAGNEGELTELLDWLLDNPGSLRQIARRIEAYSKPDASMKTAELIMGMI